MNILAIVLFALAMATATIPRVASAAGLRWTADGGVGVPIEIRNSVGLSPRALGSLTMRLTEGTEIGFAGDYAWYNTNHALSDGTQWRALALVRWHTRPDWFPWRMGAFGELGLGGGRVRYVEVHSLYALAAPASRLAAGLERQIAPRTAATLTLSFDRLDAALEPMYRHYPTMLSLSLGVALDLPRGGPIFAPPDDGRAAH